MLTNKEKQNHLDVMFNNGALSSYDYEMGSLDLQYDSEELKKTDEYKLKKLKLQESYGDITPYDYALQSSAILNKNKPIAERKIEQLRIQLRFEQIEQSDFEVKKAQIEGRPLALVRLVYDKETNPEEGYFDVKFNKLFVELLRKRGYVGETDDDVVDEWVNLQYKSVAASLTEEDLGIESYGDVTTDDDIVLEEEPSDGDSVTGY